MTRKRVAFLLLPVLALCTGPARAVVTAAAAERTAPDKVLITWTDPAPVDVYAAASPDAEIAGARLLSHADDKGRYELAVGESERPYLILRDVRDGVVTRVAERVLPLDHGSNFRDLGGYAAADGKHVRWGRIFRSAATPMLTDADLAKVRGLGLAELVDLRSNEERSLAPTRIEGVRYTAVGYGWERLNIGGGAAGADRMHAIYAGFPTLLAPQLKILFRDLLANEGPIVYNCSAGQDRTGFTTAVILSALGTPRDVIYADYELSTVYRHPVYEIPPIDAAQAKDNAAAAMFYRFRQDPAAMTPRPLYDAAHVPFLAGSLAEIEQHWGSVDAYLEKEIGVDAAARAKLRAEYLE